ncbi:MAG: hypothetical protein WBA67_09060 [Jannaschia sp.]
MLNFRRRPAEQTDARKAEAPRAAASPADKAQALLALLGDDARGMGLATKATPGADIPPEHLRRMARDLIAQVEAQSRKPQRKSAPPDSATARRDSHIADDPERRQVFSRAAPLALQADPPVAMPPPVASTAPVASQAPQSLAKTAASPVPTPLSYIEPPSPPVMLTAAEVRRLVAEGFDPATPGREHPAIVALTLQGRAPLQQAAALRLLPRGQVRGVHRALRLLETSVAG